MIYEKKSSSAITLTSMPLVGQPTIDLHEVKPFIHLQYSEKGISLLDYVRYLHNAHNIQVTTRT